MWLPATIIDDAGYHGSPSVSCPTQYYCVVVWEEDVQSSIYYSAGTNPTPTPTLTPTPSNAAPSAPTTLYVNEGGTGAQSGEANPVAVGDSTPAFSAVNVDSDSGDVADNYQIIVYSNSGCSSEVWDSTQTGMTNCTEGNRCADIDFGGSALKFDGKTYYWKIRYWDDQPAVGSYSDCSTTFDILGPDDQMRHGSYFFNQETKGTFKW